MLPEAVARRFSCLNSDLCAYSDEMFTIIETQKNGEVELRINLRHPALQFKKVDYHTWDYLNNKKCADSVILQYADGKWKLHSEPVD